MHANIVRLPLPFQTDSLLRHRLSNFLITLVNSKNILLEAYSGRAIYEHGYEYVRNSSSGIRF